MKRNQMKSARNIIARDIEENTRRPSNIAHDSFFSAYESRMKFYSHNKNEDKKQQRK